MLNPMLTRTPTEVPILDRPEERPQSTEVTDIVAFGIGSNPRSPRRATAMHSMRSILGFHVPILDRPEERPQYQVRR